MAAIITSKFRLDSTNKFVESLSDNQFYMALGRPNAWTDDSLKVSFVFKMEREYTYCCCVLDRDRFSPDSTPRLLSASEYPNPHPTREVRTQQGKLVPAKTVN